jgi:hypothetical protein
MINKSHVIDEIVNNIERLGLRHGEVAERAGIRPETWSRIRKRGNTDIGLLERMAGAVGLKIQLVPSDPLADRIVNRQLFNRFQRHG